MKTVALPMVCALAGAVVAFPAMLEEYQELARRSKQDTHPWIAPGPNDVRSPCPGTNTLANHGFINRNGKGVTKAAYQQGFLDAFGMAFANTAGGSSNAINLCSRLTNTNCTAFDLDQLNQPHAIEHDGSMKSLDFHQLDAQPLGATPVDLDNHSFNYTVWQESRQVMGLALHIDVPTAAQVMNARFDAQRQGDTAGWFEARPGTATNEQSFMLSTMNDPLVGSFPDNVQARVDWVDHWFSKEELPTVLGWTRPSTIQRAPFRKLFASVASASSSVRSSSHPTPAPTTPPADPFPIGSLPGFPSKVAAMRAAATAAPGVPPPPSVPNPYEVVLGPEQWGAVLAEADAHVAAVEAAFEKLLAGLKGS